MKKIVGFIQKFLQRFNEDPRGWGVLLVLLLGLIGERYHHVQSKHHLSISKAATARANEMREVNTRLIRAGLEILPLSDFIASEADALRSPDFSLNEYNTQLKARAAVLTPGSRAALKTLVVESDASADQKEVALRILKLAIPTSVPALSVIALTPSLDLSLRVSALEGIETAALADRSFATTLERIAKVSSEKSLADIARLSSEQVAQGRSFFAVYGSVARASDEGSMK